MTRPSGRLCAYVGVSILAASALVVIGLATAAGDAGATTRPAGVPPAETPPATTQPAVTQPAAALPATAHPDGGGDHAVTQDTVFRIIDAKDVRLDTLDKGARVTVLRRRARITCPNRRLVFKWADA